MILLAAPSPEQRDGLRATLLHALRYPLYRESFTAVGVTATDVCANPLAALERLPVFAPTHMTRLAREALALCAHDLGGVELTSGTTGGPPKRRVLSVADTRRDAALLVRLMQLAGVRAHDRVAAMDLAVEPLAAAFLEACEALGVRESVAVALTATLDIAPIIRLNPTVLIAPPSLLTRLVTPLTGADALRLVIYNGDRLYERTAMAFRSRGVGLRSLYGLTETSALGIECEAEQGVHLAPDAAVAEVRAQGREQELVVTTLGVSMPLLRYPTGDLVRVLRGRCTCGRRWPRVAIRRRIGDRFALFDQKFTAQEFQALLLEGSGEFLQIVLDQTADGRERITFRLPESARPRRHQLRQRLRAHPLLDYMLYSRLVRARLRFADPPAARKVPALVDRRGRQGKTDATG